MTCTPNLNSLRPFLGDNLFRSFFDLSTLPQNTGFKVDVKEEENAYHMACELPGVEKENISLEVENDTLTIKATTVQEEATEGTRYLMRERTFGEVERRFNLDGINQEAITAEYENGVLRLVLPKEAVPEKKAPKKISIGE